VAIVYGSHMWSADVGIPPCRHLAPCLGALARSAHGDVDHPLRLLSLILCLRQQDFLGLRQWWELVVLRRGYTLAVFDGLQGAWAVILLLVKRRLGFGPSPRFRGRHLIRVRRVERTRIPRSQAVVRVECPISPPAPPPHLGSFRL
jgi:hypothetical protein